MTRRNSVDVLRPFLKEYGTSPDVQLIGGIGMAALLDSATKIDVNNKRIIAPEDLCVPAVRANGSKRDVDVLVATTETARVDLVAACLKTMLNGELKESVFGIRPKHELEAMYRNPFGVRALMAFVSDRYAAMSSSGDLKKVLFPFAVDIDPESMEPWELVIDKSDVVANVPNPATALANYANRSISGVRKKDAKKIATLRSRLEEQAPELIRFLKIGPASSQLELALLTHSAGVGIGPLNEALGTHYDRYNLRELLDHPDYMMGELSLLKSSVVLGAFAAKANGLRFGESMEPIVAFWQKYDFEERAKGILGNR